jgi:hypothetical protein
VQRRDARRDVAAHARRDGTAVDEVVHGAEP